MLAIVVWSTILGVCITSWVATWICLEINTLAICWIVSNNTNNSTSNSPSFLYYLIQVCASILILVSVCSESIANNLIIVICLLTNVGIWPTHSWYINLINMINIEHTSLIIIITWQNILPLTILISINNEIIYLTTLILYISLGAIFSPLTFLNGELSINSIIALSSLNNNGWILITIWLSLNPFLIYISLYSTSLSLILNFIKSISTNINNISLPFWCSILIMCNLGGLPPLTIFWANIIVINTIIIISIPSELAIVIMIGACYLLYHYLWITLNETQNSPVNAQITLSWNISNLFTPIVIGTTLISIFFC